MQIITTATIKGGTGKTTTAAALAQCAANEGKNVLCIDLDPQGDFSFIMGADANQPGAVELLHGADVTGLIQKTDQGADMITGTPDLATETTKNNSANRLNDAISPIKRNYDFIFIDTPPHMGELTFNALQCATGLIIPLEADGSSLQGFYQITDLARAMQKTNKALKNIGCIITRYDQRAKINRFFYDTTKQKADEQKTPLLLAIRPGIAIKEAQIMQKSLYDYAPKSKPAQDYKKLYDAISTGRKWQTVE